MVEILLFRAPHPIANPWSELSTPIHVHTVLIHDWTSVHGAWDFVDTESPIIDYTWAIGEHTIYFIANNMSSIFKDGTVVVPNRSVLCVALFFYINLII